MLGSHSVRRHLQLGFSNALANKRVLCKCRRNDNGIGRIVFLDLVLINSLVGYLIFEAVSPKLLFQNIPLKGEMACSRIRGVDISSSLRFLASFQPCPLMADKDIANGKGPRHIGVEREARHAFEPMRNSRRANRRAQKRHHGRAKPWEGRYLVSGNVFALQGAPKKARIDALKVTARLKLPGQGEEMETPCCAYDDLQAILLRSGLFTGRAKAVRGVVRAVRIIARLSPSENQLMLSMVFWPVIWE